MVPSSSEVSALRRQARNTSASPSLAPSRRYALSLSLSSGPPIVNLRTRSRETRPTTNSSLKRLSSMSRLRLPPTPSSRPSRPRSPSSSASQRASPNPTKSAYVDLLCALSPRAVELTSLEQRSPPARARNRSPRLSVARASRASSVPTAQVSLPPRRTARAAARLASCPATSSPRVRSVRFRTVSSSLPLPYFAQLESTRGTDHEAFRLRLDVHPHAQVLSRVRAPSRTRLSTRRPRSVSGSRSASASAATPSPVRSTSTS